MASPISSLLFLTTVALSILSAYLYDPYQFDIILARLPPQVVELMQGGQKDRSVVDITAFIGKNNVTTLECWTGPATALGGMNVHSLGDISGGTHLVFPKGPAFDGGSRNAPALQFVIILKGSALLTFPQPDSAPDTLLETLRLTPDHIYIAGDTADVSALGHHTLVAGGSRILQLPIKGGVAALGERIVRNGACY
ncbi:hypothetical protein BDZ89DRAFT_1072482 [Hymenopellis radicata]|nr:hypothetical protein BDZ89DRAFT_1072482 [Hymenopellis radicata]